MVETIPITGLTDGLELLPEKMAVEQGQMVLRHGRDQRELDAALSNAAGDWESNIVDLGALAQPHAAAQNAAQVGAVMEGIERALASHS